MNDHYNRKFSEPGILRQVFRPDRLLIVTFGIAQLFCQPCPGVTDETSGHPPESVSEQVRVDGIVTGRRKYSFTLKGLERDYEVFVPNGTVIGLRLTRPSFDWPNHQLLLTIPISAVDGDAANNKVFKFPLPKPLILTAIFDGSDQKQRAMGADIKRINKFALSSETSPNLKSPLVLQGEVLPGEDGETLQLKTDSASHKIILGRRHGTLSGFSILDLKPNITDVFVTGEFDGEKLYADSIEFAPVGDPLEGEDPNLPRCLFLGDSVSFNYQRPLREALAGNVNLHHPPTNCRGSNNWRAIHRWLGNYTVSGRHWDVITFNFGLDDEKSTKDAYQTNLKRAIEELQKTDAKLIWVTTTPIPFGFLKAAAEPIAVTEQQRAELVKQSESLPENQLIGHLPGRMALQNRWAEEVLQEFPGIAVCDLWQVVKDDHDQYYRDWWFARNYNFDYTPAVPLARTLATEILRALGRDPQQINPPEVHAVKVRKSDQ